MSAKNKQANKQARKLQRDNKATRLAETKEATDIPPDVSSAVLVSLTEKLTRAARETWHRSRDKVIVLTRKQPKSDSQVYARRVKLLPLAKVIRRRFQSARRMATASYVASKLHPESTFRPAVIAELHKHRERCLVAHTELANRGLVTQPTE